MLIRLAAGHLLDIGHRRIALITGGQGLYPARERIRGYQEAYAARGLVEQHPGRDPAYISLIPGHDGNRRRMEFGKFRMTGADDREGRHVLVPNEFVVRASIGPPPHRSGQQ
jgi:hypothetical protein